MTQETYIDEVPESASDTDAALAKAQTASVEAGEKELEARGAYDTASDKYRGPAIPDNGQNRYDGGTQKVADDLQAAVDLLEAANAKCVYWKKDLPAGDAGPAPCTETPVPEDQKAALSAALTAAAADEAAMTTAKNAWEAAQADVASRAILQAAAQMEVDNLAARNIEVGKINAALAAWRACAAPCADFTKQTAIDLARDNKKLLIYDQETAKSLKLLEDARLAANAVVTAADADKAYTTWEQTRETATNTALSGTYDEKKLAAATKLEEYNNAVSASTAAAKAQEDAAARVAECQRDQASKEPAAMGGCQAEDRIGLGEQIEPRWSNGETPDAQKTRTETEAAAATAALREAQLALNAAVHDETVAKADLDASSAKLKTLDATLKTQTTAKTTADTALATAVQAKADETTARAANRAIDAADYLRTRTDRIRQNCIDNVPAATAEAPADPKACKTEKEAAWTDTLQWLTESKTRYTTEYATCKHKDPATLRNVCTQEWGKMIGAEEPYAATFKTQKEYAQSVIDWDAQAVRDPVVKLYTDCQTTNAALDAAALKIACQTQENNAKAAEETYKVKKKEVDDEIIKLAKDAADAAATRAKGYLMGTTDAGDFQNLGCFKKANKWTCAAEFDLDVKAREEVARLLLAAQKKVLDEAVAAAEATVTAAKAAEVECAADEPAGACAAAIAVAGVDTLLKGKEWHAEQVKLAEADLATQVKARETATAANREAALGLTVGDLATRLQACTDNNQRWTSTCDAVGIAENKARTDQTDEDLLLITQRVTSSRADWEAKDKLRPAAEEAYYKCVNAPTTKSTPTVNDPQLSDAVELLTLCGTEKVAHRAAEVAARDARLVYERSRCKLTGSAAAFADFEVTEANVNFVTAQKFDWEFANKEQLAYQHVGASCKRDFSICEPEYGAEATRQTTGGGAAQTVPAKLSTNGKGMCCGVAQPPNNPPAQYGDAASFKARYKDTLVCNYYNGPAAESVGVKWVAKTKDEPEGCLFADEVSFTGFRCMPSGAQTMKQILMSVLSATFIMQFL